MPDPTSRRTLVLMRHAKAEGFAADDHERRLTERGHRDASAAGAWLAEQGLAPTAALVSTAARTRETWHDLATAADLSLEPDFDDGLYSSGPDAVLELLHDVDPDTPVLAVVGHNPTVAYLAQTLTDAATADPTAFRAMARDHPTSGIAVFEVDGGWDQLGEGSGRLVAFWAP